MVEVPKGPATQLTTPLAGRIAEPVPVTELTQSLSSTQIDGRADRELRSHEGRVVGHFRLLDCLGEGGMGVVYAAYDEVLDRKVAIKLLRPSRVGRTELRERTLREARALGRLSHPNVVPIYEIGEAGDWTFIVMELVEGQTLRTWQRAGRTRDELLEVYIAAAHGLIAAHRKNLVHRDFKPDNVMVGADGRVRVMDFGLASLIADQLEAEPTPQWDDVEGQSAGFTPLTRTGKILGTPAYMSPEQMQAEPADAASDQFAFCVALYEALYRERPFTGEEFTDLKAAVTRGEIRAPPRDATVPDWLRELVCRGLAIRREDRFESMQALIDALVAGSLADEPAVGRELTPEREKLMILLDKVERFWIEGILDKTAPEDSALVLRYRSRPSLVKRPWEQLEVTLDDEDDEPWPATDASDLLRVFVDADRSLLILGEPGSGKTTTLLSLGRELIRRAKRDPRQPIPVVLNLSSWAAARGPLSEWIVLELTTKYQIPAQIGQEWIATDQLVLLLDELDGAQQQDRQACVRAINEFRRQHGLTGLVVCGRSADYRASELRLELGDAMVVQPLDGEQIADHVARSDSRSLKALLERDAELQRLARSPLMLKIIEQVYAGTPEAELEASASALEDGGPVALEQRRQRLFAAYVARMNRPAASEGGDRRSPSPEVVEVRLSWLATQMLAHNQATFLIEQLQPSWLPSRAWLWLYLVLTRGIVGFVVGVCVGLISVPGFNSTLWASVSAVLDLSRDVAIVVAMTGVGTLCALAVAVVEGLMFERRRTRSGRDEGPSDERRVWRDNVIVGSTIVLTGLGPHVVRGLDTASYVDPVAMLVFLGMALRHHHGRQSARTDLRAVEALAWSWGQALRLTGTYGLALITFGLVITVPTRGWHDALIVVASGLPLFLVYGGLRGRVLEVRASANQGIRLSLRNSLYGGVVLGGAVALYHLVMTRADFAVLVFFSLGVLGVIYYGLGVAIGHFVLRLLLWASGRAPLDLVGLLEAASARALLRRVGGGYIFMHRHMIDYFARLPESS